MTTEVNGKYIRSETTEGRRVTIEANTIVAWEEDVHGSCTVYLSSGRDIYLYSSYEDIESQLTKED